MWGTQKTLIQSLGQEDPLLEEMGSILVWRMPWTEEPGGPQTMGSQRAGHGWATTTSLVHFLDHETKHETDNCYFSQFNLIEFITSRSSFQDIVISFCLFVLVFSYSHFDTCWMLFWGIYFSPIVIVILYDWNYLSFYQTL